MKAMQPFFTPDGAAVVFAAAKSPTELPALHIVELSGASHVPQRISEPGLEITSAVIATP
ncbi:MAG: hypothetical protein K8W52_33785 [Deltaproteobacteria bacterium]|nr:hypothetical protein [Deltaproteobacteria bacterium]